MLRAEHTECFFATHAGLMGEEGGLAVVDETGPQTRREAGWARFGPSREMIPMILTQLRAS